MSKEVPIIIKQQVMPIVKLENGLHASSVLGSVEISFTSKKRAKQLYQELAPLERRMNWEPEFSGDISDLLRKASLEIGEDTPTNSSRICSFFKRFKS